VCSSDLVAEAKRRICDTPKRVLLLPPDITRMHSGAGKVTEILYHLLADEAEVHVIRVVVPTKRKGVSAIQPVQLCSTAIRCLAEGNHDECTVVKTRFAWF